MSLRSESAVQWGVSFTSGGSATRLASCKLGHHSRLDVLQYSRMSMAGISFFGALTVVIFSLKRKPLKDVQVHPLLNLLLADMILSAAWFAGAFMFHHGKGEPCDLVAYIILSLEITSHLSTVVYAFVNCLYLQESGCGRLENTHSIAERGRLKRWRIRLNILFYIIAWLLPLGLALPQILDPPKLPRCIRCLMLWAAYVGYSELAPTVNFTNITSQFRAPMAVSQIISKESKGALPAFSEFDGYANTVFICLLMLSMIFMMVIYGCSWHLCNKLLRGGGHLGSEERKQLASAHKRITLYLSVFFYCWTVPLLVALWVRISGEAMNVSSDGKYAVLLVQAFTMPMQGFLNSLVYGWTRKRFRDTGTALESRNYGAMTDTTWQTHDT